MNSRNFIKILSVIFILASCDKPVQPEPQMTYTDLKNQEIKFNESVSIDLNNDGKQDISFFTQLFADPITRQDKHKYLVSSKINCMLPINGEEHAPVLSKGERIPVNTFSGYEWYGIARIELAQKIIGMTGDPYWEGLWTTASHSYLPVQLLLNSQRFAGWIELSFDAVSEKIILHRAAISKYPERVAIAGA